MRDASKAARTRVWMIGVNDKIWFLREGLFAKYVVSLVGLVVFVLAVNGATETWISYRATKTTLIDAMSEKAEATARRIEQSISELERQIRGVPRASARTRCPAAASRRRRAPPTKPLAPVMNACIDFARPPSAPRQITSVSRVFPSET